MADNISNNLALFKPLLTNSFSANLAAASSANAYFYYYAAYDASYKPHLLCLFYLGGNKYFKSLAYS